MRWVLVVLEGLVLVLSLAACGGSGGAAGPRQLGDERFESSGASRYLRGVLDGKDGRISRSTLADPFVFRGFRGEEMTLTMRSDVIDSYLLVENGSGEALVFDDDSGGDLDAQIQFTLPRTDHYTVIATSYAYEEGPYRLEVVRQGAARYPVLSVPTREVGRLRSESRNGLPDTPRTAYAVDVVGTGALRFDVEGADLLLHFYDRQGHLLSSSQPASRELRIATVDPGRNYLVVSADGEDADVPFTLSVTRPR